MSFFNWLNIQGARAIRWVFRLLNWFEQMPPVYLLLLGFVLGCVAVFAFTAMRKAHARRQLKRMWDKTPGARKYTADALSADDIAQRRKQRRSDGGKSYTTVARRDNLAERETRLGSMMTEVRDLIIQLTDLIANTNSVSGEAGQMFDQARSSLENLEVDANLSLGKVRQVLLAEIDRMVKTNITLRRQLEVAEDGMTMQKKEIDTLKTMAHVDPLTRLLNRGAFNEAMQRAFENWKKTKEVFSLLFLDIDRFKNINDSHGHLHGDRLLQEVAIKIKEGIRDQDQAARYGGEEFAVILPDTQAEEALVVGTRIREAVEQGIFQVDGRQIRITISGGIAQSGSSWSTTDVIDLADKALYTSKKKGRNRITLAEDHVKESWTSNEGL